jgi:hypothetical protein
MNRRTILHRLDSERRSLIREGESLEILPNMTRVRSADGSHHHISHSALTCENADAVIGQEVAHYRALGVEVEWKAYGHDSPPDLLARLARQGFAIGPAEAVLVLDLESPPAWVKAPPGHPVVRVADTGHVAQFRGAAERIFRKNYQFTADELTQGLRAGSTQHLGYLGMDGQTAASIGRLYTHPDSAFGGLYGGGTIPSCRGRGMYRAVVAARAKDAVKMGALPDRRRAPDEPADSRAARIHSAY